MLRVWIRFHVCIAAIGACIYRLRKHSRRRNGLARKKTCESVSGPTIDLWWSPRFANSAPIAHPRAVYLALIVFTPLLGAVREPTTYQCLADVAEWPLCRLAWIRRTDGLSGVCVLNTGNGQQEKTLLSFCLSCLPNGWMSSRPGCWWIRWNRGVFAIKRQVWGLRYW